MSLTFSNGKTNLNVIFLLSKLCLEFIAFKDYFLKSAFRSNIFDQTRKLGGIFQSRIKLPPNPSRKNVFKWNLKWFVLIRFMYTWEYLFHRFYLIKHSPSLFLPLSLSFSHRHTDSVFCLHLYIYLLLFENWRWANIGIFAIFA